MELKIQDLCKSYGKKKALWKFTTEFENGIYGILGRTEPEKVHC